MTVRKVVRHWWFKCPKEYIGESTDIKPTEGAPVGSTFLELDTKKAFIFDGETWREV